MKKLLALILLCLTVSPSFAKNGGALYSCSAIAPTQATSAGVTVLKRCDAFTTNQQIDVNNTQQNGFDWYPQSITTAYLPTPVAALMHDGTGTNILGDGGLTGGPTNTGKALQTMGHSSAASGYTGTPVTGSFYAEIEMKFNPTQPPNQGGGNCPAFWNIGYEHYLYSSPQQFLYPYVELDFFEYYTTNNPRFNILEYTWNGGSPGITCDISYQQSLATLGNPVFSNYNTYGILFLTSSDNGGTGLLNFYLNNNLVNSCTYSASGSPTCTQTGGSGCPNGAISELDTEQFVFMIGTGYYSPTPWPVQIRNFHLWQKA